MWNEERALSHGVIALIALLLAAAIISLASETRLYWLQHDLGLKLTLSLVTLYCWLNGMYLWLKGFARFKSRLESPWKLAVYVSGTIFSGFYMYYRHGNEVAANGS